MANENEIAALLTALSQSKGYKVPEKSLIAQTNAILGGNHPGDQAHLDNLAFALGQGWVLKERTAYGTWVWWITDAGLVEKQRVTGQ